MFSFVFVSYLISPLKRKVSKNTVRHCFYSGCSLVKFQLYHLFLILEKETYNTKILTLNIHFLLHVFRFFTVPASSSASKCSKNTFVFSSCFVNKEGQKKQTQAQYVKTSDICEAPSIPTPHFKSNCYLWELALRSFYKSLSYKNT